jgi:methylenetetrahydrofolate reductase (NADPH)
MQFKTIYAHIKPALSVEVFPPKTDKGMAHLRQELTHLTGRYRPAFVSVTYGAGGSTRDKTLEMVQQIRDEFNVTCVPHFTCVGASQASVRDFVDRALAQEVENMVALRGDIPQGATEFEPAPDGFRYANELVAFLNSYTDRLDLAVAGYPEGHPQAPSLAQDIEHLKQKVDAGAAVVLTQLFYDNASFFRFRELAVRAGVTLPIVPGIMPIIKFSQIQRITSMCGATIPGDLQDSLLTYEDGSEEQRLAGIEYAIHQCRELLANDVPGLHLYTLNNGWTTSHLVDGLQEYLPENLQDSLSAKEE